MGIEEFNEVGVVRTVGNSFVRKQCCSSPVDLHDDGLAEHIVFTPLRQNMVERFVQCVVILIFIKNMLLQRVEKAAMSGIGTDMQRVSDIFHIMVLAQLELDIGVQLFHG